VTLVRELFWVDLAFGAVMALACYAMAVGLLRPLSALLGTRFLVFAGAFSYSTYLIHYPVMSVVKQSLALPVGDTRLQEYLILLIVGVPLIALASYAFYRLVERRFLLKPRT
jgi:peptidoglycan/LPS O-acetylase OafA/YrhL